MVRELGQAVGGRSPRAFLEQIAEAAVELGAPRGRELRVDGLANQRVREAVAAWVSGDAGDHVEIDGRREQIEQLPAARAGDRGQERKVELPSRHGRGGEHGASLGREGRQALQDGAADAARDGEAARRRREPVALLQASPSLSHDLVEEEGVALGLAMQSAGDGGRDGVSRDRLDEPRDLGGGEAAQHQLAPPPSNARQRLGDRRIAARFGLAIGPHDDHRCVGELVGQEVEEQQRRLIGAVEILEHEQHGRRFRDPPEKGGRVLEEVKARRLGLAGRGCRLFVQMPAQLRHQSAERANPRLHLGRDPGSTAQARVRPEDLEPGPVRRPPLGLAAAAPQRTHAVPCRLAGELAGQPGLPDPGLASYEEERPTVRAKAGEAAQELLELPLASDEDETTRLVKPSHPPTSYCASGSLAR